jgi:phosphohistidine phosphatase
MTDALALVPDVVIATGTFKYVLLRVASAPSGGGGGGGGGSGGASGGASKLVVRGADKEFHKGVKQEAERALRADPRTAALSVTCPGGGRIRHEPALGKVFVYGYSNAYGVGDHAVACELIRRAFPAYRPEDVTWSNDGY